jgi:hypothetical protein
VNYCRNQVSGETFFVALNLLDRRWGLLVTQQRGAGETIADEDLGRISPLIHSRVISNRTYHFASRNQAMTFREHA